MKRKAALYAVLLEGSTMAWKILLPSPHASLSPIQAENSFCCNTFPNFP